MQIQSKISSLKKGLENEKKIQFQQLNSQKIFKKGGRHRSNQMLKLAN